MRQWTDDLRASFPKAQAALFTARTISLPVLSDQLWIVTDGALHKPGIGATLYITRNDKLRLAGFFSAKLQGSQLIWLPCEVEALAIAVATKHFSPYLIQSHHKACIFTNSKPCVQAYEKLCRGEFSASPPRIYLSAYRKPLPSFCQTPVWLCDTTLITQLYIV